MANPSILRSGEYELTVERLGPLPIVNHFLDRIGLESLLDDSVPTLDRRCRLSYATRLGVLLRSIIVEREPIYRQQEFVMAFSPEAFGLGEEDARALSDDQVGRALDKLFDADRGTLLTAVMVAVRENFSLACDELHNDSTSVRLTGQYGAAKGRSIRGKRAPWITHGYSKDHRPDLKQLLFILTTSTDGDVPVQFRHEDGNTTDAKTHIATWESLCELVGHTDFLYVADSKLCTYENMDYIHRRDGRFVTVLPRSRREDEHFRELIQKRDPEWEVVWDRENPRHKDGPRDVWRVHRDPIPSAESWPVIWAWSSLLTLHQGHRRRERIARASEELQALQDRLSGPRPRKRDRTQVQEEVDEILRRCRVKRYVKVKIQQKQEHSYKQTTPGRAGPDTKYRRISKKRWKLTWETDEERVAYDQKSDGMYPLLTNDRSLTPAEVLEAHKRQPAIEKRFQQVKTVHEVAPVLLKNEARIEALFFLYFLGLLVQALIEREIRNAMEAEAIESLPIYPEGRPSKHPTTEQVLRLFSGTSYYWLQRREKFVTSFTPTLTELQREVLRLLGVPETAYAATE